MAESIPSLGGRSLRLDVHPVIEKTVVREKIVVRGPSLLRRGLEILAGTVLAVSLGGGVYLFSCEAAPTQKIAPQAPAVHNIVEAQKKPIADIPAQADKSDGAANTIEGTVPAEVKPTIQAPLKDIHDANSAMRNDGAALSATQPQLQQVEKSVGDEEAQLTAAQGKAADLQKQLDSDTRKNCDAAMFCGIAVCAFGGLLIYLKEVWAATLCFVLGGGAIAVSVIVIWIAPWIPLILISLVSAVSLYYIATHKSIITNLVTLVQGVKQAMADHDPKLKDAFFGTGASPSPATSITTPATKKVVAQILSKSTVPAVVVPTPAPAPAIFHGVRQSSSTYSSSSSS